MDSAETPRRPGLGFTIAMTLVWVESCVLSLFVLFVVALGCNSDSGDPQPSYCHTGGRYSDTGWFLLFGDWALMGVVLIWAAARTRKTGDYAYAIGGAIATNAVALFGWRLLVAFT
jgi:hypothetical protein